MRPSGYSLQISSGTPRTPHPGPHPPSLRAAPTWGASILGTSARRLHRGGLQASAARDRAPAPRPWAAPMLGEEPGELRQEEPHPRPLGTAPPACHGVPAPQTPGHLRAVREPRVRGTLRGPGREGRSDPDPDPGQLRPAASPAGPPGDRMAGWLGRAFLGSLLRPRPCLS